MTPSSQPQGLQESLLRLPTVLSATGMSRSQLYDLVRRGSFPAPIPLTPGSRSRAFVASEVQRWIAQRIEDSRGTGRAQAAQ